MALCLGWGDLLPFLQQRYTFKHLLYLESNQIWLIFHSYYLKVNASTILLLLESIEHLSHKMYIHGFNITEDTLSRSYNSCYSQIVLRQNGMYQCSQTKLHKLIPVRSAQQIPELAQNSGISMVFFYVFCENGNIFSMRVFNNFYANFILWYHKPLNKIVIKNNANSHGNDIFDFHKK